MRLASVRWAWLGGALILGACGSTSKTAGGGSTSSGSTAGSSASSGSSGASSSGSSGGTSSGGSSGSSGASSSSGSSGSTGGAGGHIHGALTYNTHPLTHEAYVAVFDHKPQSNDPALALIATDGGTFDIGPLDAGSWWVGAVYAPGTVNGGPILPDGGLWPGWVPGEYEADPVQVSGDVFGVDIDISPLRAVVASVTVNVSGLGDAGLAPGGYPLPDGGLLFPALVMAAVGGSDPTTSLPINDATLVTATTDAGSAYSLSFHAGVASDIDHNLYSYEGPLAPISSIRLAEDDAYTFTVSGSAVIGATETRRVVLSPLRDVPVIASPADNSTATGNSTTVAWVDAAGATGASIDVDDVTTASSTRLCSLAYPQHTPLQLDAQAGCAFQNNHRYKISVNSIRAEDQPQGITLEVAVSAVRVQF